MSNNNSLKSSISARITIIIILIFILMFPTFLIINLINERKITQEEVIDEVSSKWGGKQTIIGPVLSIPYKVRTTDKDSYTFSTTKYAHFLPDLLSIEGEIVPEMRRRGVYEVVVYNSILKFNGEFSFPEFSDLKIANKDIIWQDAFLSIGIPDMSGIQESITVDWNNKQYSFNPGVVTKDIIDSGISTPVMVETSNKKKFTFSFNLILNGSRELNFVPIGKATNVKLVSNWTSPSFRGSFLPDNYQLNNEGFVASWKVLHLNRNFPQRWLGSSYNNLSSSEFGVELLIPIDEYQKTLRSAKYAILLISLTFLVFFFIEIFNKMRIHPVQYLLVGSALCIFYILLLSISEQLNFNSAYIISGIATILLITIYSKYIFQSNKFALLQGIILLILYGFVYTIIQLEDYALLMGSIGLFVILAIVMFISKRINWYNINVKNDITNNK